MDENKLRAMAERGYRLVRSCGNCHYNFRTSSSWSAWGLCQHPEAKYDHKKHGRSSTLPNSVAFVCDQHKWSEEIKTIVGKYFDEPWKEHAVCHCGQLVKDHTPSDNHMPVEMTRGLPKVETFINYVGKEQVKHCSKNPFDWGYMNAAQDECEGCPGASAGSKDRTVNMKREDLKVPDYVPTDQAEEYLRGYWKFYGGVTKDHDALMMYASGHQPGDKVILQNLEGRKYNPEIPLEGTEAIVREKPNPEFPDDAVQIEWRKGVGAVDARCLRRRKELEVVDFSNKGDMPVDAFVAELTEKIDGDVYPDGPVKGDFSCDLSVNRDTVVKVEYKRICVTCGRELYVTEATDEDGNVIPVPEHVMCGECVTDGEEMP